MQSQTQISELTPTRQARSLPSTAEFARPRKDEFENYRKGILARHRKCINKTDFEKLVDKVLCGEMCFDARNAIGHGRWLQWIDDNFSSSTGFGRRTAQRYIDEFEAFQESVSEEIRRYDSGATTTPLTEEELLHAYCKKVLADRKAARKEKAEKKKAEKQEAKKHSNESITLAYVIDAVTLVLKAIDLDPCAHSSRIPAAIGELNYKRSDDGLVDENSWPGTSYVWPGHLGDQSAWAEKALRELKSGVLTASILCLSADSPNLPESLFHYPMAMTREPLAVGYLEDGVIVPRTLPVRSLFFYLSAHPDLDRFAAAFSNFAVVFTPTAAAAVDRPLLLTDATASAD